MSNMTMMDVNPNELLVDYSYQRNTDLKRLKRKTKGNSFDINLFNAITVSQRTNGKRYIVAGATRTEWAKEVGVESVPALVYTGLTIVEEAGMFRRLDDDRIPIKGNELFKAALVSGDENAIKAYKIIRASGFDICDSGAQKAGYTNCAKSILEMVSSKSKERIDLNALRTALRVAYKVWKKEPHGGSLRVLKPLALMLDRGLDHGFEMEKMEDRLLLILPKFKAKDLVNATRNGGGNCWTAGAKWLVEQFNYSLKKNRFPEL